jgi:hypothetical protein
MYILCSSVQDHRPIVNAIVLLGHQELHVAFAK